MFSADVRSTSDWRASLRLLILATCMLACAGCSDSEPPETGADLPPANSADGVNEGGARPPRSAAGSSGQAALDGAATPPDDAGAPSADAKDASASGDDASTVAPSVPCPSTSTLKVGENDQSMMVDGRSRTYRVHVPPGYAGQKPVPLLVDLHGAYSTGIQQEQSSGWSSKADATGFIVVYPDGVQNSWNVGNCCLTAMSEMIDDVGFIRKLVGHLETEVCIDPMPIYASGLSNGGGLTHRLACEAADLFAAAAPVSSDLQTDPCKPARPITVIEMRGLADTLVPYDGGTVGTGSGAWVTIGAKASLEKWKTIDQCTGAPVASVTDCETYKQCAAGVEVTLCSVPGVTHFFYSSAMGFSTPDVVWDVFTRFTLP